MKIIEKINEMEQNRSKISKMNNDIKSLKDKNQKIENKLKKDGDIFRITKIMTTVEKELLINYKEYKLKSTFTWGVFNSGHIDKIKNGLLYLYDYLDYGEGDYIIRTCKVPLEYFDMTDEEIKEKHTEWSLKYIEKKVNKQNKIKELLKTEKLKKLELEIEKLKKEI